MEPKAKFHEMSKVRVHYPPEGSSAGFAIEGYVIETMFLVEEWVYKISHAIPDKPQETFDNWVPEEWMEKIA